jgi:hypothetical protein
MRAESHLWAVTVLFNPFGHVSRPANFRHFRERLPLPLLAVELTYGGRGDLKEEDADKLVRLEGRSILWQKERLLNVALEHLPESCETVAWLDCDVIFGREDWGDLLESQLERFQFVQLFEQVCDLPRGFQPDDLAAAANLPAVESTASRIMNGRPVMDGLRHAGHRSRTFSANGLAWAARTALLRKHGIYDACILGSGDRAMVCAAIGAFDACQGALFMNDRQVEHYLAWARSFHGSLQGSVGCIEGTVFHLWHGEPSLRRIGDRYSLLEPYRFDPWEDIAVVDTGCWEWSSEKGEMHRAVLEYFRSRHEI